MCKLGCERLGVWGGMRIRLWGLEGDGGNGWEWGGGSLYFVPIIKNGLILIFAQNVSIPMEIRPFFGLNTI